MRARARPAAPGKAVYAWGITAAEVKAFLTDHPEARDAILAPRTVVRRADAAALTADLATLDHHPALDTLHPGLRGRLQALRAAPAGLYAVPYAVAYADRLERAYRLLHDAAENDDHEPAAIAALPAILEAMRERGLAGVRVDAWVDAPVAVTSHTS